MMRAVTLVETSGLKIKIKQKLLEDLRVDGIENFTTC